MTSYPPRPLGLYCSPTKRSCNGSEMNWELKQGPHSPKRSILYFNMSGAGQGGVSIIGTISPDLHSLWRRRFQGLEMHTQPFGHPFHRRQGYGGTRRRRGLLRSLRFLAVKAPLHFSSGPSCAYIVLRYIHHDSDLPLFCMKLPSPFAKICVYSWLKFFQHLSLNHTGGGAFARKRRGRRQAG